MFDISFAELVLIAVIAVVVIGPERLPETVRSIALWLGRLRRMASRLYKEVEQEVGMDDIRRQLHNEEILRDLKDPQRREEGKNSGQPPAGEPGEGERNGR